jgi:hypothetical protein
MHYLQFSPTADTLSTFAEESKRCRSVIMSYSQLRMAAKLRVETTATVSWIPSPPSKERAD